MAKEFSRARRVEEQIKRELAGLTRTHIDTAQLGMLTFTAVKVSADLSIAKVYFTTLGAGFTEKQAEASLNEQASDLRYALGQQMRMRSIPQLRFYYDVSIQNANEMEKLLDEIASEPRSDDN